MSTDNQNTSLTEFSDLYHEDPEMALLAWRNQRIMNEHRIASELVKKYDPEAVLDDQGNVMISTWDEFSDQDDANVRYIRIIRPMRVDRDKWEQQKVRVPERFIVVQSIGNWIRNIDTSERTKVEDKLLTIINDFQIQFLEYLDLCETFAADEVGSDSYYDNKDEVTRIKFDLKIKYELIMQLEDYSQILTHIEEFTVDGFNKNISDMFYRLRNFGDGIERLTSRRVRSERYLEIGDSYRIWEILDEVDVFIDENKDKVEFIREMRSCNIYIINPLVRLMQGLGEVEAFGGDGRNMRFMLYEDGIDHFREHVVPNLIKLGHIDEANHIEEQLKGLEKFKRVAEA